MTSHGVDKLLDQQFRRTVLCTKYLKIIKDKNHNIPLYNNDPIDCKLLTEQYIRNNGLKMPLLIKNGKKDLHMRMLDESIRLSDIASMLGTDTAVKVCYIC